MEEIERSFAPEWLKGASGVGATVPQVGGSHQDDSESLLVLNGRQAQQVNASTSNLADYDFLPGSTYADRVLSSSHKNHMISNSGLTSRNGENTNIGRSHSNVTCGSLNRGFDALDWDQDGYKGNGMWEERDIRVRGRYKLVSHGLDEKDGGIEKVETGMLHVDVMRSPGQFLNSAHVNRSQSMGLSPRVPNSIGWKFAETTPLNGGLASSIQKAAFERNFPSLGFDEKPGSLPTSPGSGLYPVWQLQCRADMVRSASPSLPSSGSSSGQSINGGADAWSSALADVPLVNGGASVSISPTSSSGSTSATSCTSSPVTPTAPLNMAEALIQNTPRARTPPQLLVDTQRLEELALKQSRQLIPVVPSLHKFMSDKNKSKSLWWMDNGGKSSSKSTQSSSSQINTLQKSLSGSSRPDSSKQQGKLLLSRSSKDMPTAGTSRLEVPNAALQGALGGTVASNSPHGTGVSRMGRQKPVLHHRSTAFAGVDVCRAKELMEDRRAQGRIDFFNALRKKAVNNGVASSLQVNTGMDTAGCLHELQDEVTDTIDNSDLKCPSMEVSPVTGGESLFKSSLDTKKHVPLPVDSEEEEVAFMRSIGWEENAENSELTEEEINAFFEMRESRKLLNSWGCKGKFTVSSSANLSCSHSEWDSELHV